MIGDEIEAWRDANREYLAAWLEQVLASDDAEPEGATLTSLGQEIRERFDAEPALDVVYESFSLSDEECRALILIAAPDILDDGLAGLAADLPRADRSVLSPAGALRRWRIVDLHRGGGPGEDRWRVDERVLDFVRGISYLDPRLDGIVRPVAPTTAPPPSHIRLAQRLGQSLLSIPSAETTPCLQISGSDPAIRRAIAAAAAAGIGADLFVISVADVPAFGAEQAAMARLWEREAALIKAALVIEIDDQDADTGRERAGRFAELIQGVVFLTGTEPIHCRERRVIRTEIDRLHPLEQRTMWTTALGGTPDVTEDAIDAVVSQFALGPERMAAVAASLHEERGRNGSDMGERLWERCRAEARIPLDALARRMESEATWEDLVLPPGQRATLRQIVAQVRQRYRVYNDWGFAEKDRRGLGITTLFAGPSGTGKTLAAEVLVTALRLDLYRIDLSSVVSKYIGETEKNLRRLFEAAEVSGAILLFDEADALFGKRSDVKDSHDRYANIEISYLLQQMEAYRGMAILTTNMKDALDKAFLRRLRFVVHFPFPDAAQRAEVWKRILPPRLSTDGLDVNRLAQLHVTGGSIRNIAVNAAFIAADAGEILATGHILQAARSEYAKMERPMSGAETEGWV